jgi:hypothetical protein
MLSPPVVSSRVSAGLLGWAIQDVTCDSRFVTRDEYLRVPFVLVVESVEKPGGDWLRRASYPELPGAVVEAESAVDAMDLVDDKRIEIILSRLDRGMQVPVPRPPL